MSSTPVRWVLLDADGVLQRVPRGAEESMRPAIEGLVDDVEGFLAEAVAEERPALRGEVRWLDVLPGVLARWGAGDAYDDVVRVWLSIEEVPGTHALVRSLRASGVSCALATNQDVRRAEQMREQFDYDSLFDALLWSHELRAAKPDPSYFTAALDRLGTAPAEVLFVDDRADNVASAREVGLHAEVWSYREPLATLRSQLAAHGLTL